MKSRHFVLDLCHAFERFMSKPDRFVIVVLACVAVTLTLAVAWYVFKTAG